VGGTVCAVLRVAGLSFVAPSTSSTPFRSLARTALNAAPGVLTTDPKGRDRFVGGDPVAEPTAEAVTATDEAAVTAPTDPAFVAKFLELAAATNRGQTGSPAILDRVQDALEELESMNPTASPAASPLLDGKWALVYASEDPTRCSPFFWAWRQRFAGTKDTNPLSQMLLGSDDLIENIFTITDSVPIKSVGLATQEMRDGVLKNQVAVTVSPSGTSQMTTTSAYEPDLVKKDTLRVTVEKTQVLDATWGGNWLDNIEFPYKDVLGESATIDMKITYLDDRLRIVRDPARPGAVFAFARVEQ